MGSVIFNRRMPNSLRGPLGGINPGSLIYGVLEAKIFSGFTKLRNQLVAQAFQPVQAQAKACGYLFFVFAES